MELRKMELKTLAAFAFLGLVGLASLIGLLILFIIEPSAMIPVAFVGFFGLVLWSAVTVVDYYDDRKYNRK